MTAFVIAAETVKDEAMFTQYLEAVSATVEEFGGKFIVRGGKLITVLQGAWPHSRLVVIEFSSRELAERWYNSPACQKIVGLRLNSTEGNIIIVDGSAGSSWPLRERDPR